MTYKGGESVSQNDSHNELEGLKPVAYNKRVFRLLSYILMWWSSVIVIQGFVLGQSMLPPAGKLNFYQAVIVMVLASLILGALYSLSGTPGLKYGIPFTVQSRAAFGPKGSRVATIIRAIPAVFWYGIGTWIGAMAINQITNTLFGVGNVWVYFFLFQVIQTLLAYKGIKSIKWFDVTMALVLVPIMAFMMYTVVKNYGFELSASWNSAGSWGEPFFISLVAVVGAIFTSALNNSDLTRHLEPQKAANWVGHMVGVTVPYCFLIMLGIMSGAAVGIWDPIQALAELAPGVAVAVILLLFIALAQFTTNLTMNCLPSALVIMETTGLSWGTSVIIVGVLGIATMPWLLFTSQNFFSFIAYYSAFLGPVLGVMLADYFLIRKQKLVVRDLYNTAKGIYFYKKGWNWAGLVSVLIGGIFGIIYLSYSWMIAMPVGFILYLVLYKVFDLPVGKEDELNSEPVFDIGD